MHAIEGVLASLLVLIYLGNIVSAPGQTDWDRTSLTKRASDLLSMLSRTGHLDQYIVQDDPRSLDALLNVMGAGLGYTFYIQGLPERQVDTRVVMNDSEVLRAPTRHASSVPSAPESEFEYRRGSINGIEFVLSDSGNNNSIQKYNYIHFDFNDDGDFDTITQQFEEGPFVTGETVDWCPGGTCTDHDYQIGYMNETLTMYNLTPRRWLWQELDEVAVREIDVDNTMRALDLMPPVDRSGDTFNRVDGSWQTSRTFNGVDVQFRLSDSNRSLRVNLSAGFSPVYRGGDSITLFGKSYEVAGVSTDELVPLEIRPRQTISGDVLLATGIDPRVLDRHRETVLNFLSRSNTVFEALNMSIYSRQEFEDSVHSQIGLEMIDLPMQRRGIDRNVFPQRRAPGSAAGFIEEYFYGMPIDVPEERMNFTPNRSQRRYATADVGLAGQEYELNVSYVADRISISDTGDFETWYDLEEEFQRSGNIYSVSELLPVRIETRPRYRFTNLHQSNITGAQTVLTVEGWEWDPEPLSFNVTGFTDVSRPPGAYDPSDGEGCSDGYRQATIEGTNAAGRDIFDEDYSVTLSNRQPCDVFWEFINLDLNQDGDYADLLEEQEGYSREGPYQFDDTVTIENTSYRITVGSQGTWMYLERVVPDTVPTAVWTPNAYQGNGNVFYIGEQSFGDDTRTLLQSVIFRAGVERHRFTTPSIRGDPTIGVSVSDSVDQGVFMPYTVDSLWWFR